MFKLLIILTFSIFSSAFDSSDPKVNVFNTYHIELSKQCSQLNQKNECADKARQSLEKVQLTCEMEIFGAQCNQLSREHPEWEPLMRHCDNERLCEENENFLKEQRSACWRGFQNAAIDLGKSMKDMASTLADYVDESWEKYREKLTVKNFAAKCDKSFICKKNLVKNDPVYSQLPDEKLAQMPAGFLIDREKQVQATLKERKINEREKNVTHFSQSDNELTSEQMGKLNHLIDVIDDKVHKEYNRFQCYNPLARQELRCYAVGTLIDPLSVTGYFLKGARAATAIGLFGKFKKTKKSSDEFKTTADILNNKVNASSPIEETSISELDLPKENKNDLKDAIKARLAEKKPKPTLPRDIITNSSYFRQVVPGKKAKIVLKNGKIEEVSILKYDQIMAEQSGLAIDEVVALRRNFAEVIPETGETGVFRLGKELVVDSKVNLIESYSAFSNKLKTGAPLTADDFISVRTMSYELRSVNNGTDLISVPFAYKGKYSSTIKAEIPSNVQERLKHYGISYKIENGKTIINYPESSNEIMKQKLQMLADEANQMIKNSHPPERVASFLVQDLLILHPFQNGNGRTARLMGQAIYKNLTGKNLVFPSEFHKEMEFSLDHLSKNLIDPTSVPKSLGQITGYDSIIRKAYVENNILPETKKLEEVISSAPRNDVSFPKKFKDFLGDSNDYDSLPIDLKVNSKDLFYGRPGGDSVAASEKQIENLFKYGRGSREANPHFDLNQHSKTTSVKAGPSSGFFSATESFLKAAEFSAKRVNQGVIFVIDPKDAEILNLYKMPLARYPAEKEVLFGPRLNPSRIRSAVIFDHRTGKIEKIINNPLYNSK